MKILLAEDDNDMRRFLVKALQNAGYEVASFDNGLSAYDRLREEPFELLLTDIVMPEMDGIELARRATELDPDLKVMFITGFAAVALNPDSKAPKDAKILSKPFHLRDLVNEVEKMIAALSAAGHAAGPACTPGTSRYIAASCEAGLPAGWAHSSAVEHCVDIAGVRGSIPRAPTISADSRVLAPAGVRLSR